MPGLGRAALVVAFGLAVFALLGGGYAAWRGRRRLAASARNALVASSLACAVAAAVLWAAYLADDFSLRYVAQTSSRDLPAFYALTAFWGGQEGSLLLWALVLTGMGSLAVLLNRRLVAEVVPWTVPVLAFVATFFLLILVFVSSPFVTIRPPMDGSGLNTSLQNPYMAAHPPLLYVGYVGLTIPFAFAMAALLSRRSDEHWLIVTRRWTLAAWAFLGLGILVGAKWAYEEIGWGGWYAWDPVENAALMPWLVATAYLHSVMVQEKKDMLRVWNMALVALAFCLSLFGTFLTRSGVLNSIHSFTESSIGPWLLGFIAVVAAASTGLIVSRVKNLRARTKMESLVSREAAFLYNNLFLVAFALTVLWGVAWPLVSEAVRGVASTVGAPYYDFFGIAFGLPIVLLMGLGPLVAWRRATLRSLGAQLAVPATVGLAAGVALAATDARESAAGLVGYSFSAFVLAAISLEFVRGTRARKSLGDPSWPAAFAELVRRNRRRYGGYLVHAAIALLTIGAVGVGAFNINSEGRLRPGQALQAGPYTVRLLDVISTRVENREEVRARLGVSRDGSQLGTVEAGKNRYFATNEQPSNEVAIRNDWLRAEDLMIVGDQFNEDGTVDIEAHVNPLVNLIWLAGIVFLVGFAVAMWPDAREQTRIARRFAVHA